MINSAKTIEILKAMADRIEAEKDYLTELDNEIADGDHGVSSDGVVCAYCGNWRNHQGSPDQGRDGMGDRSCGAFDRWFCAASGVYCDAEI